MTKISDLSLVPTVGSTTYIPVVAGGVTQKLLLSTLLGSLPTRLRGLNGAFDFPAFSFINDNDTGMYLATTNTIGFATGGIARATIDGNGRLSMSGAGDMLTNQLLLTDGVTAPSTSPGFATIYIDTADGDLKIKYGDGTVKTIVVDT